MRTRSLYLVPAVLLFVVSAAFGQAPDCTGISGVHNTDPDLINELDTVLVADGLINPIFVTAAPGDDERLFVVEQAGRIKVIKDGVVQPTPFINIQSVVNTSGTERGLLGMAFHPDYANNGYFFVYYTAVSPSGALTVARYQRSTPDVANPASAEIVIAVPHPISNHNAGMIAFSPVDGHLYVGTGDGGSGCDPGPSPGNSQNLNSLLGKMLRLNVDSLPYTTTGNPFDGGTPGEDEIWDIGLRNPWRWSFDRVTGAQYIGDVGQNQWEEVDCSRPTSNGAFNYGWVNMEGTHGCPNPSCGTQNPCPPANYLGPIREYPIGSAGRSVVGGYVYRGCRMPDLHGTYFYSDYYSHFVLTLRTDAFCSTSALPDVSRAGDLAPFGVINNIASYGEDNQGELYMVDRGGQIYKVVPELFIMEVSGQGAAQQLMANADGEFEWEDLEASSDASVRAYKVYRSDTYVAGIGPIDFQCEALLFQEPLTTWGETQDPATGQVFYYLVAAQNADVEETVPGVRSDGTPRVVDTASSCFD
jgi:hypothetical protein